LRLKSPSRPWPTASCSSTPGQPAPSTTGIVPAGASTASRFTSAWRNGLARERLRLVVRQQVHRRNSARRRRRSPVRGGRSAPRSPDTFSAPAAARRRPARRRCAPPARCPAPPLRLTITCRTRGSRLRTSASISRSSNATFASLSSASIGSSAGYSAARVLAQASPLALACWRPSRAIAARRPCADSSNAGIDLIRIGEAGLLAGDRAHAHALLDRMRTVLDDAVLHAPALVARMLEIQVAEVDARAQQAGERALQRVGIQAGGSQQAGFGDGECVHGACFGMRCNGMTTAPPESTRAHRARRPASWADRDAR
jgi:hypothetical protein